MSVKSDRWIKKMVEEYQMIKPFEARQVKEGNISYGLSSYGRTLLIPPQFSHLTSYITTC